MQSALKPRDVPLELAEQFLSLVRGRGISTRPPRGSNLNRKAIKGDLAELVRSLIVKLGLEITSATTSQEQLTLLLGVRPRHVNLPVCREVASVIMKRYPSPQSRKTPLSSEQADTLTVCFACFFVREGFRGQMRWRESLDPLRNLVVNVLLSLGHTLEDSVRLKVVIWPRVSNWACLARKDGAHHEQISISEGLARKSA